jgi:hypothetical protein
MLVAAGGCASALAAAWTRAPRRPLPGPTPAVPSPAPTTPPPAPPDALLRMLSVGGGSGADGAPAPGASRLGAGASGAAASASGAGDAVYKVLVLDKFCRDVVAPLLRVSELRRRGVTLHLALEAERQPIADVPAVYLLQPSQKGAERLAADLAAGLYDSYYLNFAASVPNRLLESIAAGALASGNLGRVARVADQYVSFVALEPGLFSLGLPGSYVELNDPGARDSQIEVGDAVERGERGAKRRAA